jgi:hypothetical protein
MQRFPSAVSVNGPIKTLTAHLRSTTHRLRRRTNPLLASSSSMSSNGRARARSSAARSSVRFARTEDSKLLRACFTMERQPAFRRAGAGALIALRYTFLHRWRPRTRRAAQPPTPAPARRNGSRAVLTANSACLSRRAYSSDATAIPLHILRGCDSWF